MLAARLRTFIVCLIAVLAVPSNAIGETPSLAVNEARLQRASPNYRSSARTLKAA